MHRVKGVYCYRSKLSNSFSFVYLLPSVYCASKIALAGSLCSILVNIRRYRQLSAGFSRLCVYFCLTNVLSFPIRIFWTRRLNCDIFGYVNNVRLYHRDPSYNPPPPGLLLAKRNTSGIAILYVY